MGKAFNLLMFGFVLWPNFASLSNRKVSILSESFSSFFFRKYLNVTLNNYLLPANFLVKIRPLKEALSDGC